LETRFGPLADWVLSQNGLAISAADRIELLREVGRAATEAGWCLKRNALGDYSPDPVATRFPAFELAHTLTLSELWGRWQAAANPSANTIKSWRAPLESLKSFLGHEDAHRISERDIVRWKDHLLSLELAPKTINDGYLSSMKAILNQAVRDRLLTKNPVADISVAVRRRAGEGMLPYSNEDVRRLLQLASHETEPAFRWLPLLAATTGARIGELAQLWGNQIVAIDGILAINIRPAEDGGSLKNESSERLVPLHPAVIDAGFLAFAESRGKGPLFYRRSSGDPSKRHASKGVTNRLAAWIRKCGFDDLRKSPNHALRHWWKTAAARVGIQDSLADAVQGHAGRSVASTYRHFDLKTLADAVAKIPVPGVGAD
jgi:integrase